MWRFLTVSCILWGLMDSKVAARHMSKRAANSYAGSYANGYGGFAYAPTFGFPIYDPFAFHQQLTSQIFAQQAAQQSAIASTFTLGDSTVTAEASNLPNDLEDADDLFNRNRVNFFNNFDFDDDNNGNDGFRYAPNYAAASASLGPDGGYQTVFITPENPDTPNISNRFSSTSPDGFKGVAVSSYSSSSDINGKKSSQRAAQATINDNGRITTYKIKS